MELENLNFDELNPSEALMIDGGYWRVIYEAVRGGVIYDGIKAGINYLKENPVERPEYLKHKMGGL